MKSNLSHNPAFVNGWQKFCQGLYLEDCTTEEEKAGWAAAWRKAELS